MRYDYKCDECSLVTEVVLSMSECKDSIECPDCAGTAVRVFTVPHVICKGNQRAFNLDKWDVPIGWERGNTDTEAQERRYAKQVVTQKKLARENDKAAIKNGIRKIGMVPRELARKRQRQYGRDYWNSDVKSKLKEEGLYFHND